MSGEVKRCPQCGTVMKPRLGLLECPDCGATLDPVAEAEAEMRKVKLREPWKTTIPKVPVIPAAGGDPAVPARRPEDPAALGPYAVPRSGMAIPASGSGVLPAYLTAPDSVYAVAKAEMRLDRLATEKGVFLAIQFVLCLWPTVLYTDSLIALEEFFPGLRSYVIGGVIASLILSIALLYLDYLWVKYLGCGLMALGIAGTIVAIGLVLVNPILRLTALWYLLAICFQIWMLTICWRDIGRIKSQTAFNNQS